MNKLDRRAFLKKSLLTTASVGLLPAFGADEGRKATAQASATARIIGANGDIRYAVVGFHGRGADHIKSLAKVEGTRLVALCDVDRNVLDKEVRRCQDANQPVEGYTDIRKLLENKNIDAVTFATPNHWHSLGAIWAVQADKDVYVEKPVSHEVWEGRQLVNAARKHNRIVQAGTQARSSQAIHEALQWMREGHLGKILRSRGLCYKRRASIGKVDGPQPIPASVDYDLWCGPAPKEPLMRKNLHYDWHWVWPTGNGDLGNQGIHQMDLARWALGESLLSPRILSVGGRLGYVDDGTTPNTLIVFHDYPTAPLIFEVRGLPANSATNKMDTYHGESVGVVVECESGSLGIPSSYGKVTALDQAGKEIKTFEGGGNHFENFIKAVRSGKHTDLNGDILEGHISSALCHTGNISYRLGKQESPEPIREAVKSNKDLAEALGRMEEHLAANNVDLHKSPAALGAVLKMDPKTEQFIDNPAADALLTREYRAPFIVPEKV